MGTLETIAVVVAVYAVVFLAHKASRPCARDGRHIETGSCFSDDPEM